MRYKTWTEKVHDLANSKGITPREARAELYRARRVARKAKKA